MKKFLATVLAIVMLVSLVPAMTVSAATSEDGVVFTKTLIPSVAGQPRKIKLEAYTTGSTTASQTTMPADIILVLDQSGSMDDTINGETKLQIMKDAVASFANEVAGFNTGNNDAYRLAIVGFASESGYDDNTEILTAPGSEEITSVEYHRINDVTTLNTSNSYYIQDGDEYREIRYFNSSFGNSAGWYTLTWGSFRDEQINISNTPVYERVQTTNSVPTLGVVYNSLTEEHYANSFVNCTASEIASSGKIAEAIAALDSNGATRTDLGMNIAAAIFDAQPAGTYDNRSKIVVVITDGVPTTQSEFSTSVANSAVGAAKTMKDGGAHIFSMYLGTPSSDSVSFLQALSSNYPDATAYNSLGTQAASSYYSAHTDASAVTDVFEDIAFSITANSTLNETSITTDIISEYFRLPITSGSVDDAYRPEVYTVEKTATGWASEEVPFPTATVTIENGKTVTVTGFNFAYHCVTETSKVSGGDDFGRKLVIYIPIVEDENADTFGGYLPTNDGAAIYQNAAATEATATAPSVHTDATLKYSLADAEYWKHVETATTADFNYDTATLNPLLDKMIKTDYVPDGENNRGVGMTYNLIDTNLTEDRIDDTVIATVEVEAGQSLDVTDFANWTRYEDKNTLTFTSADDYAVEAMYALECVLKSENASAVAPYDTLSVFSLLDVEFVRHNVHIVGGVIDEGGTLTVASIPADGTLIGNTYRESIVVEQGTPLGSSAEMTFTPKTGYEIAQIIKKTSTENPLDTSEVLYDITDGTNKVSYGGTGDFEYQFTNVNQGMAIEVYTRLKSYTLTTAHDGGSEIMRGTTYTYSKSPLEVFFAADEGHRITSITVDGKTYDEAELLSSPPAEINLETAVHNGVTYIVDGDVHVSREADHSVSVTSDKVSYKLTYKYYKQLADGSVTPYGADEAHTLAYGEALAAPTRNIGDTAELETGVNYTLRGWYDIENNQFSDADLDAMTMPAEDLTFYAYWEKNPDRTFNLPIDGSGITKKILNASGQAAANGEAITFTFKAMFHEHEVSKEGGETITLGASDTEGSLAALSVKLTDFQKQRFVAGDPIYIYEVKGDDPTWIYDDVRYAVYYDGRIEKADGTAATEVVFTNQKAPYLVNYDLSGGNIGGSETVAPKIVEYSAADLLPQGTAEKVGYEFAGWMKDTTEVSETTTYSSLAGAATVTEITLVAQWTPKNYTVEYDLAGGKLGGSTTVPDKTNVQWNDAALLPAGTPTKANHSFDGWYYDTTSVSDTTTYSSLAVDPATAKITLTAKWTYTGGGGGGGAPTKYTLTYESNGGTEFENEKYTYGTVVDVNKTPQREGYIFDGWHLDESFNEDVDKVKMTKNITVYAAWIKDDNSETDEPTAQVEPGKVPDALNGEDHFAYVVGYPDGNVRPNSNITRAEVSAIFFRLLKDNVRNENLTSENSFTDVVADAWYNKAVSTLAKLGIVDGRQGNGFYPDAFITRAEFAAICARFDASEFTVVDNFTDVKGHWAESEIHEAAAHGWIKGYEDGTFKPDRYITRAEAMTMINRVLNRTPETAADLHEDMIVWPDNSNKSEWYYLAVQEATNSHDYEMKNGLYEKWIAIKQGTDWTKYE